MGYVRLTGEQKLSENRIRLCWGEYNLRFLLHQNSFSWDVQVGSKIEIFGAHR